jgi:hypothetical protein
VLAAPSRETWEFDSPTYRTTTTLAVAAKAVDTAVRHDVPVEDTLVDRLVQLLRDEPGHWHALGALTSVVCRSPPRARRLLTELRVLPLPKWHLQQHSNLIESAEREAAKVPG